MLLQLLPARPRYQLQLLSRLQRLPPLIYPCELLFGIFCQLVIDPQTLLRQRRSVYVLRSSNLFNQVFAYNGNLVWSIVYIALALVHLQLASNVRDLLPRDRSSSPSSSFASSLQRRQVTRLLLRFVYKFVLKIALLYIVFEFIDFLFIFTGGSCTYNDSIRNAQRCKRYGGEWVGGFDISGHICFLVNISMILWIELANLLEMVQSYELNDCVRVWHQIVIVGVLTTLFIWVCIIAVTSVYYHTIPEKILGLLLGYVCPLLIYKLVHEPQVLMR